MVYSSGLVFIVRATRIFNTKHIQLISGVLRLIQIKRQMTELRCNEGITQR